MADKVYIPNVVTPNNNSLNDVWQIVTNYECWMDWDLKIYNRWGGIVFETTIPSDEWICNSNGGEHYVSSGVYAYVLRAKSWNTESIEVKGHILVIR